MQQTSLAVIGARLLANFKRGSFVWLEGGYASNVLQDMQVAGSEDGRAVEAERETGMLQPFVRRMITVRKQ